MANDRKHCHKKAEKGYSIAICDRVDYLKEANKQVSNKNVYKEVEFKGNMLTELDKTSNKFLRTLKLEEVYQKRI